MKTLLFMSAMIMPISGQNLYALEEIIQKIQARDLGIYKDIRKDLQLYLDSEDVRLRESVMVALAQIPLGGTEVELLSAHLPSETNHSIRASVLRQIEPYIQDRDSLKDLVASTISEPFQSDDAVAAEICGKITIPKALEGLMAMAKDSKFANGIVALEALRSNYLLPPSFYEWLRSAEAAARDETDEVKRMMANYPDDYSTQLSEGIPSSRFQKVASKMLSEHDEAENSSESQTEKDVAPAASIPNRVSKEWETNETNENSEFRKNRKPSVESITLPRKKYYKATVLVSSIFCLLCFFTQMFFRKFHPRWLFAFFLCLSVSFILMSLDLFSRLDGMQNFVLRRKITFNLVWPTFYLGIVFAFIVLPVYLWIPQIIRNLPTLIRGLVGVGCAAVVVLDQ